MQYTYSITSKGQITIPKEFRDKLGLDKIGKATFSLNAEDQIVLTVPQSLSQSMRQFWHKHQATRPLTDEEITQAARNMGKAS